MKLTIESTEEIVELQTAQGVVPARIWEGHTESGIPVVCFVTRVAVEKSHDHSEFERELREERTPSEARVFPLRMVL